MDKGVLFGLNNPAAEGTMARLSVVWVVVAVSMMMMVLDGGDVVVAATSVESCAPVRSVYHRQGFHDRVPNQPISGGHLKMCQGETTCCTEVMERNLGVKSRQEFDNNLKNLLNPMASLLAKKNVKLNELFGKLLNFSRKSFDEMFSKTYGILYQQNAYVFTNLYDNLEKYYKDGELDLQDTMDSFFQETLSANVYCFQRSVHVHPKIFTMCYSPHGGATTLW